MFADHATAVEEKDRPEGSVRRWVGSIKELWVESDGTVKAKAAVIDEDLKAKVRNLAGHGLLGEMEMLKTTKPTASKSVMALVDAGILIETTGRRRDRTFHYAAYLSRLSAGTELPS